METFFSYFDMGADGPYIWSAYGISGLAMAGLLLSCAALDARCAKERRALMDELSENPGKGGA
ncbi:hypothetical protein FACS1894205_1550 [Alphaproteobacteria bacterium]|nr:hypothetical protein FACS1894205_1550 [Alphaproteobacteria bacterium]